MNRLLISLCVFLLMSFLPFFIHTACAKDLVVHSAVSVPIPGFLQNDYPDFSGKFIVETRDVSTAHVGRGIVLWMDNSAKNQGDTDSCPGQIQGNFYQGITSCSLLDLDHHLVLQTTTFSMEGGEADPITVPFEVPADGYMGTPLYSVTGKMTADGDMKPVLLDPLPMGLRDNLQEFALFETDGGCFLPDVIVYGYDPKQDNLFIVHEVDYNAGVGVEDLSEPTQSTTLSNLFFAIRQNPAQEKYDFASDEGHGSDVFTLHRYKYDSQLKTYYGISVNFPNEDEDKYVSKYPYELKPKSLACLDQFWKKLNPRPDPKAIRAVSPQE